MAPDDVPDDRRTRRRIGVRAGGLLAVVLAGSGAVLGLQRLLADRPASLVNPLGSGPASATVEHDGVVVSLTTSESAYQPGEVVWASMRVVNTGETPARWSGACGGDFRAVVRPAAFDDPGRSWEEPLGSLKQRVLERDRTNEYEAGPHGFALWEPDHVHSTLQARSDLFFGCRSRIRSVRSIPPDGAEEFLLGWDTTAGPAGSARVEASFHYLGREPVEETETPDDQAFDGAQAIRVAVEIALGGERGPMLSPAEILDVVLEDDRFARWAEEHLDPWDAENNDAALELQNGEWTMWAYRTDESGPDDLAYHADLRIGAMSGELLEARFSGP